MGHKRLARDHLVYCDLAIDRQKSANDTVRAHHARTVSRVNPRNSALADTLRPAPDVAMGGLAWVYNSASTIRQGVKANTDAKVHTRANSRSTGLAVGPCSAAETPDVSPPGSNLLYLDFPSDPTGSDVRRRVANERCNPCSNPHDSEDMPKYLPAGLRQDVINIVLKKSAPYHVT